MTLGFSTQIKGKPTYFIEKIWQGLEFILDEQTQIGWLDFEIGFLNNNNTKYKFDYGYTPNFSKIHTIREDKRNRWKVGNNIHFVINNRTKNSFQFAPVLKVKSIQKIKIVWDKPNFNDVQGLKATIIKDRLVYLYIDDKIVYGGILLNLIKNDGFDNAADFFDWFDKDFEGKIIHWTDYSY